MEPGRWQTGEISTSQLGNWAFLVSSNDQIALRTEKGDIKIMDIVVKKMRINMRLAIYESNFCSSYRMAT